MGFRTLKFGTEMENIFQSQTFIFKPIGFVHQLTYNKTHLLSDLYIGMNLINYGQFVYKLPTFVRGTDDVNKV
jgi:hypothetical protein